MSAADLAGANHTWVNTVIEVMESPDADHGTYDDLIDTIDVAILEGRSPSEAGLPDQLFDPRYVRLKELEAKEAEVSERLDGIRRLLLMRPAALDPEQLKSLVEDQAAAEEKLANLHAELKQHRAELGIRWAYEPGAVAGSTLLLVRCMVDWSKPWPSQVTSP